MVEFIVKYWIEWLLGLVVAALSIACKKIYKLYKGEKAHQKTKEQKEFYAGLEKLIQEGNEASQKADEEIKKEMSDMRENITEEIGTIRTGVLSIQGEKFKALCHDLLNPDHLISQEEYEDCMHEHQVYNSLGGNHDGDAIFKVVVEKSIHDIANHQQKNREPQT